MNIGTSSGMYGNVAHRSNDQNVINALGSWDSDLILDRVLKKHQPLYQHAKPFPHMYSDDIFPESLLLAAASEIPEHPPVQTGLLAPKGCIQGTDKCFTDKYQFGKNALETQNKIGPVSNILISYLKSSSFIKFLEKLSGIENLIPDPHYSGSGIHQTLPGGFLGIHADFNRYKQYDLHRRVNVFIFLNANWTDSYGGHLELWNRNLTTCEQKILPILGRLVVFSSTDFSYHGHQTPLSCPHDRSRRSLAMYYYTRTRPVTECISNDCYDSHRTLFVDTKCSGCSGTCLADHLKKQ